MSAEQPRFILQSHADQAQLSASSAATHLPVSNLTSPLRGKVWRTTSAADQYLDLDLGAERDCNVLALVDHNLTFHGTLGLQAGDSPGDNSRLDAEFEAWEPIWGAGEGGAGLHGAGGYLSPEEVATYYPAGTLRIIYFPQKAARHWRLSLHDPDHPQGYLQVGRIFLHYFRGAGVGVAEPMENLARDPSRLSYSKGGQVWRDRETKFRDSAYQFNDIPSHHIYGLWFAMKQELGVGRSFVADFFPGDPQSSRRLMNQFYCHLVEIDSIKTEADGRAHLKLSVRESR